MKATEQYFPVVLFIMLYKVVLTFESADKTGSVDQSVTIECTYQLTLDTSDLLAMKCTKPMPNRAGAAYRGRRR